MSFGAPGTTGDMMMAFNPDECAEHHPVSTGLAIAPFHIAPELSFRVGKRISLGLFSRLQVVTGEITRMFFCPATRSARPELAREWKNRIKRRNQIIKKRLELTQITPIPIII